MSKFEVLDYQLEGKNFKFETCPEMIADALDDMASEVIPIAARVICTCKSEDLAYIREMVIPLLQEMQDEAEDKDAVANLIRVASAIIIQDYAFTDKYDMPEDMYRRFESYFKECFEEFVADSVE